jgi:hypothetical protein
LVQAPFLQQALQWAMQLVVGQSGMWIFWDKWHFAYHWVGGGNEDFCVVWWHDAKLDANGGFEKWSYFEMEDEESPWFRVYDPAA